MQKIATNSTEVDRPPSVNYRNRAPFSHIHVQCAKWAIKKTNSIREVLGACLCVCSLLRTATSSTALVSLMMHAGKEGGREDCAIPQLQAWRK